MSTDYEENDTPVGDAENTAPANRTPVESKRKKGFSSNQKTRIEAMCRAKIEEKGGRFIKINWKKKTVHFIDGKGNRCISHPTGAF